MTHNIYMVPTPSLQDASGQQTGYIAANVLVNEQGQPVTDENGNYILT